MAWAWNKVVNYVLVEAWSAWGCAWTSLGFLPPLSQEEVGKEGDWFWLPLCNYYCPPPPNTYTDAGKRRGGSVLGFCCPAYAVGREGFQGPCALFECLDFGFSIHGGVPSLFFSCLRKVTGLRGLSAGWISSSHPRSGLLEHPFGTKCVGRAVPPLDTLETPFPFPGAEDVETYRENTFSFKGFSYNL